jgi:hypothetical protein
MKTIYSKYNRSKHDKFQLEIRVVIDNGNKYVIKRALTEQAVKHIENIYGNNIALKKHLIGNKVRLPEIIKKGEDHLYFEFIYGESLEKKVLEAFLKKDRELCASLIGEYRGLLEDCFESEAVVLGKENSSPLFKGVNLKALPEKPKCFKYSIVDPIFDNIIIKDNVYYLIDNEWHFNESVPIDFVFFRALLYFYKRFRVFKVEQVLPFDGLLKKYSISKEAAEQYQKMEDNFQDHALGSNAAVSRRYLKKQRVFSDDAFKELLDLRDSTPRLYKFMLLLSSAVKKLRRTTA